jgi:adenylate cyclase
MTQSRLSGARRPLISLPTGTVTFLFTDIEGSTELLQRLGDRLYAEVLEEHRRLLRDAFAEGNGQEIDTQGDAFLVAFSRARDAVGTAVAAQQTLTLHAWPDGASPRIRMGLHTGEPVSETLGYVGLDVHRAARICSAGHGGQILLSNIAAGLAAPDLPPGASLRDLGTHRLKDLKEPEHLFQVEHPDLATDFPPLKSLEPLPNNLPLQPIHRIGRPDMKTAVASTRRLGRRAWLWAVALVVIAATAVGIWRAGLVPRAQMTRPTVGAAPRLSIVVLPFASLGKETDQGFADAIVHDLTTDLSRISGSFVIAWSTAANYKGKVVDSKQIGRDLGVRYVLEGSVERAANHVRVNAQLIDAETNSHLWAERFDRELGDLFAAEDEITSRIANTLGWQLVRIEAHRAERIRTNPKAMDYIMRARVLGERPPSKDRYRQQQELFERAMQLDDRLPIAQAELAGMLAGKVLDNASDEPEADLRRADDLVSKMLADDSNNGDAHFAKAQILRAQAEMLGMQDRFQPAIAEYKTVLAHDRNYVDALSGLARCQILVGMPGEAIPLLLQILRIDPRDPAIGTVYYRLGLAYLILGHTGEAIQWYRKAIPVYDCPACAYVELGAALSLKGDKVAAQAALAEFKRVTIRHKDDTTIAKMKRWLDSDSKDPKYLALREGTIYKGLRKAGVPEE